MRCDTAADARLDADVDVVVVGSGVAGLAVALGLAGRARVLVVSSGAADAGSTAWAQGGIAAAVRDGDDPAAHARDTLLAGAGACDPGAVAVLTDAAPSAVADLLRAGARLDTDAGGGSGPTGWPARPAVTREGGHRADRIVHAGGDATGAEVSRVLLAALAATGTAVVTGTRVEDVLTVGDGPDRRVAGVALRGPDGVRRVVAAPAVVLATGGIGHAYASSTNPPGVTGDGLALALRAGAVLTDLEFVQFHPTALWTGPDAGGRLPLVSEAVRGAGAVLVDATGARVMGRGDPAGAGHPLADLAPRDVVARAVTDRLADAPGGVGDHVLLDTTGLGAAVVHRRFPTMVAACAAIGVDPVTEPVPVAPAEHFLCGGVRADTWGRTGVPGLYAVGEVAATGVHGANRLASNSLLEGLVVGRRTADRLMLDPPVPRRGAPVHDRGPAAGSGGPAAGAAAPVPPGPDPDKVRAVLSRHAGIRRSADGLATAADLLAARRPTPAGTGSRTGSAELVTVARAVVAAAAARAESRGCHWRSDAPAPVHAWSGRAVEVRLGADGVPVARMAPRRTGGPAGGSA